AQELELPSSRLPGQGRWISVETVHSFGINRDVGPGAGRAPALGHEERIVDQAVHGPDREQCLRHVVEASVQRRNVGVAALLEAGTWKEVVAEPKDDGRR